MGLGAELLPIKIFVARASPPHDLREVVMDDLFFYLMFSHPPLCMFGTMNVVFPSSGINAAMKESGVCITIPQI